MFSKLKQIIQGEDDEQSIFSSLRNVKFDLDFDEAPLPFQKYLSVSYNVEDSKGNPGTLGHFFVTNLKLIWQMKNDPSINLVVGLDSIVLIEVKTLAVQWGNGFKHMLTVKAQNPSQVRYQFKFSGYQKQDLLIFKLAQEIYKKVSNTKSFRCTNLSVKFQGEYQPMDGGEELKSSFSDCKFFEDRFSSQCQVFITNCRIVIVREGQKKMNMGIPWLMIRQIQYVEESVVKGVRMHCRGLMGHKFLVIQCKKGSDTKKLEYELKSFCQVYNKSPILGFTYDIMDVKKVEDEKKIEKQIVEFDNLKININRRKKAYQAQGSVGSILNTEFNQEIGLMMEKIPNGMTREDLWEIMK